MTAESFDAPGWPGIDPTWSSSAKDAVGTSELASRVWFTIGGGILNEVYWPRVDRPQIRDLGFIVADDAGFWSEVKRDTEPEISYAQPGIPAVTVVHHHPRYALRLRICADNFGDVVRIEARLEDRRARDDPGRALHPLRLYPLLAPHLGLSGRSNHAWVGSHKGRMVLFAQHEEAALALASDPPPVRQSVGYVGASDGWQDFAAHGRMTWTYRTTEDGNVAVMSELILDAGVAQLALAFGVRPEEAANIAEDLIARFRPEIDELRAHGGTSCRLIAISARPQERANTRPPPARPRRSTRLGVAGCGPLNESVPRAVTVAGGRLIHGRRAGRHAVRRTRRRTRREAGWRACRRRHRSRRGRNHALQRTADNT
jgi:Glucodextranase, domain N